MREFLEIFRNGSKIDIIKEKLYKEAFKIENKEKLRRKYEVLTHSKEFKYNNSRDIDTTK